MLYLYPWSWEMTLSLTKWRQVISPLFSHSLISLLSSAYQLPHNHLIDRMLFTERLEENHWLFNISLWDSNRAELFSSSPHPGHIPLFMLAVCLLVIVVLGFGFYLWFFITSSEHSHVRLLNILNVYLSGGCIGASILGFTVMITSGLGYQDNPLVYLQLTLVRFHVVAITLTFLLISMATFLNQFQPKVYLDISVAWKHYVSLPAMLLFCIITQTYIILWVKHCCISSDHECIRITNSFSNSSYLL